MAEPAATRVFLSYRRDDAAGYAGRLEEALERRLGRGSAFRDVLDIAPGDDFVRAIRARLADAQAVLVLIGPRWAGGNTPGQRRIDDPQDMVRLEVATALDAGLRVIPVLLQGAAMPAEDTLPAPLRPLARHNALALTDTHWDADLDRLIASLGLQSRRRVWRWALGGAAVAAAVAAAVCVLGRGDADEQAAAAGAAAAASAAAASAAAASAAAAQQALLGGWTAQVTYPWGDRYTERFEFERHAGQLTGTAGFLGYPRGIEQLSFDGRNLHFETHTQESVGSQTYELTHRYGAELRGTPPDQVLAIRMQTTGGLGGSRKPLEFEARRAAAPASAPGR